MRPFLSISKTTVMDLPLLRALQAMKHVEDDPSRNFQTKTMDLETFTPAYPHAFIIDQCTEKDEAREALAKYELALINGRLCRDVLSDCWYFLLHSSNIPFCYLRKLIKLLLHYFFQGLVECSVCIFPKTALSFRHSECVY